jgi:DNA replication initiation complex subunit (GINS family)
MSDYFMPEEGIDYRSLRKIQQMEKSSVTLTSLKTSYYDELRRYFDEMDNLLINEAPSQKKRILEEEIENTRKIAHNIYEQREKKIILASISKIRGGNPDLTNMMDPERELFDLISDLLRITREKILKKQNENNLSPIEREADLTDKNVKNDAGQAGNTNPIVLINEDIPQFIGTDEKKYFLRKNDVLSLPEDMCEMLLKRGVAKKI